MQDEKKTKAQLIAELQELRSRTAAGDEAVRREVSVRQRAEDQLHASELRFRRIFMNDMIPMGIWIKSGEIIEANDALLAVIGYTRAEVDTGQIRWNEITPDEYMERDAQAVREVEQHGVCAPYEKVFRHKDGHPVPILIGGGKFDEQDNTGVFYAIDLTRRKQAEEKISHAERRYRALIENAPDGVVLIGADGTFKYASPSVERLFGYTQEDLPHSDAGRLTHPDDLPMVLAELTKLMQDPSYIVTKQYRFLHKNGGWRWIESTFTNLLAAPNVEGIIINFRDIHERKLAEEKLWTEKEKLDKIAASVPGVICSFHQSPAGQTSMPYASAAVKEVYGLEPAEIAHDMSPIFSRILPDDMVHVMATIARSAHTLEIWKDEFRYQHPTKGVIWIDGYSAPVREADGGITWHGFIADVTERKLTEQKLCESEQRYTILFQKSNIPAVLIKLPEVVIVDANEASEKLTGFKREELLGKNSAELGLISHTLRTESISRFEKESSLTENEMHIVTKSGEERIILVNTNPLEIQGRPYAITSMQDITDRKRAEKNLRDSEKKYRDLINGMNDVICVVDYDTSILDVNTTATTVLGYSREELLSMKIPDIDVNLTPARIERFAKIMPADQAQVFETMHRTKDGRIIPVEVSSSLVSYGGRVVIMSIARDIRERKQTEAQRSRLAERLNLATRAAQIGIWDWDMLKNELVWDEQMHMLYGVSPADFSGVYEAWLNGVHPDDRDSTADILARALRNECEYDTEFRVVWPDGTGHWLHANGQVFRDENGKPVRMVGMNYDITERKQAERERARLEEQLQRSQKLETIGTLAGGIAHDFNNILTPIMGYTDMAIEHVAPADPLAEDLKMIFNAAKRAKELVEQILIFSRQLDIEQKPLSLHLIVKETVKLLRPTIPSTINIVQNVDASCPPVLADPTQMHQVVMNLCVNAFHAMEENGGTLTIDLQPVNVDRAPADLYPHLKEAEYVRLSISDTGKGMDPSTTNRIFEPFFTTKAPGKGTGMGLSVVHGIVRSHNGDLVVFSEPGKGSIFHVYLPVTLIEPQGGDKDPVTMMGGQEYILVVDDEVAIARMMNKMLEQLGYRADACHSSLEALDLFHYQPGKYDLVISDLTMPGMTGLALAKQLHLLKKELPIILMTGYGKNVSTETLIECGINKVIDKPILRKELAAAVREALAE